MQRQLHHASGERLPVFLAEDEAAPKVPVCLELFARRVGQLDDALASTLGQARDPAPDGTPDVQGASAKPRSGARFLGRDVEHRRAKACGAPTAADSGHEDHGQLLGRIDPECGARWTPRHQRTRGEARPLDVTASSREFHLGAVCRELVSSIERSSHQPRSAASRAPALIEPRFL
jgi:hypothetical protein